VAIKFRELCATITDPAFDLSEEIPLTKKMEKLVSNYNDFYTRVKELEEDVKKMRSGHSDQKKHGSTDGNDSSNRSSSPDLDDDDNKNPRILGKYVSRSCIVRILILKATGRIDWKRLQKPRVSRIECGERRILCSERSEENIRKNR
jgi:hypothetical protein